MSVVQWSAIYARLDAIEQRLDRIEAALKPLLERRPPGRPKKETHDGAQ